MSKTYGVTDANSRSGSSLDLSSDSDEELFLDKDEPELIHSDEEDSFGLDLSIERPGPSGRKTTLQIDNSDDDF